MLTLTTSLMLMLPVACDNAGSDDAPDNAKAQNDEKDASATKGPPKTPQAGAPQRMEPPSLPAPDDVAAPPEGATKTESGLAYVVLEEGSEGGDNPGATDRVQVHYSGWTTDGEMFDSSVVRKRPASFGLDQVIAGWTEGVQLMTPGDKFRFWIPEELAYKGMPGKPAGMLVFDVELLEVLPSDIPAPDNVSAVPGDAKKTESGLAYKVLEEGSGSDTPGPTSMVEVHYSGWTTDGKMFDSSRVRGSPAVFPVDKVIPGWTEGVQLMNPGDQYRFWIPEELAYKGKRGPQGMLVFDVELLSIKEK